MSDSTPRLALGLLGLILLWIGVYWWWPSTAEPRGISFSSGAVVAKHSTPSTATKPAAASPPAAVPERESEPSRKPTAASPALPQVTKEVPASKQPAVIPPEFTEHTLAIGETYATLSLRYYGTSAYANAISKANPLMSPTSLRAGRVVKVPKDPRNIQGIPAKAKPADSHAGSTTYTVASGDTLSTIAARLYGESKYSKLIFEANRSSLKDEHSLRVGQTLRIPPKP
jgi:nucleoid-associated protein YgaU